MRLGNIESKQLLPRFANKIAWVQNAFDSIVKAVFARAKSIDAPLTMESIQALNDDELQALYEQYGIAQYYPDLSRDTRDNMLYEMCRIYRYLGTPKAVEILCNYIFDGVPLNLRLKDNLAFDETGHLVDESLLNIFDIEIEPQVASLPQSAQDRIIANILRFSRNSQTLRDIYYEYPQSFALKVSEAISGNDAQVTSEWEQDSLCEPVPSTGLEFDLGLKSDVNYNWQTIYFGDNDWWYAGILNQEDKDILTSIGLVNLGTTSTGPYGTVAWDDAYTYELVDLFTDVIDGHGVGSVPFDPANWYCTEYNVGGLRSLILHNITAFSTGIKAWRCRITPPSQYDVWIESVDTANNVVVALRSVFTGLTAARANTIVNNAPVPLSRYNNYLSNQGGPYTQADAITMRDRLQSYIPSGDTSTFGIRPAS